MKSSALLRTNVGLTTNCKVVIDSNYGFYLDTIVSSSELSENRYKKFRFNKESKYDEILPFFFKNTPTDVAFGIRYEDDVDKMSDNFSNQYDDIYQYGARNIIDNKFYSEEYEYFAPLHIDKNNLPSNFIIFRVDGPGIINLTKDNFRSEILTKLKCVKSFDLSNKTVLGQWIDNNFKSNKSFPNSSLYIDFRRLEFSSWNGIDFESGGYTEKTNMLDSTFELEQPYSEMEKFLLNGYKDNKVVYPNLLNFSFLFDDTPATPDKIRKWSINRYLGFYFDELNLVQTVSPNPLPILRSDVIISKGNILTTVSGQNPFLEEWKIGDYPYLEVNGKFYFIEKFEEFSQIGINKIQTKSNTYEDRISRVSTIKYKVMSDIPLAGLTSSSINQNLINVTSDGFVQKKDGTDYTIDTFESSDVWLIEIGNRLHNLILTDGKLQIYSDFGFEQNDDNFNFFINRTNPNTNYSISLLVSRETQPKEFKIFKCKFTDIKDFDTDIIETDYSKFEYEKDNEVIETDEPKMYVVDLDSISSPKSIVEFKLQNVPTNIPTSSEYTANSETFRIEDGELTEIWRKNSKRVKWGFKGSNALNDYPYLLNNSLLSDNFNRNPSTKEVLVSRQFRNLDYFYTLNSESPTYSFHSVHIEDYANGSLNTTFKFDLDKYLGINYDSDYFEYFFGKKTIFKSGNIIKKSKKYSFFQDGNVNIPNMTLFKGLKFSLSEVDNLNLVENRIEKINLKNSNKFDSWKFSILLSSNDQIITNDESDLNTAKILNAKNVLKWRVIDEWKHEKDYESNSLVIFEQSLYSNSQPSRLIDPKQNPSNNSVWTLFEDSSIFFKPEDEPQIYPKFPTLIYYYQDFYFLSDPSNPIDIWQPNLVYSKNDSVIYGDYTWTSLENSNQTIPSESGGFYVGSSFSYYWKKEEVSSKWEKVKLWSNIIDYGNTSSWYEPNYYKGNYVVYEDVVWGSTASPQVGTPPTLDANWTRVYSMAADTNYLYGTSIQHNNIFELNGKFYQCLSNTPESIDNQFFYNYSLDNGIQIIINEKYKNVLVNIYVNDNTYSEYKEDLPKKWVLRSDNIKNTNRDDIYTTIFTKLSTNNFMNSINDLSNKFGFSDLIKYIVVKENGSIQIYDFNNLNSVKKLPYILSCSPPDQFLVKLRSLIKESVTLQSSEIKASRILNNSNIENISELNFYNEMHLGSKITQNIDNPTIQPNFSGLSNQNYGVIYRFSGYYSPIFKDIQLFESPNISQDLSNYKFDTTLTDFGLMKQRIVSKVNRKKNILKLRNNPNLKSIYPMLDEFGYHTVEFFIFKSTWDVEYYFECVEYEPELQIDQVLTKRKKTKSPLFRNYNTKLL
jgi:hypothetical protein